MDSPSVQTFIFSQVSDPNSWDVPSPITLTPEQVYQLAEYTAQQGPSVLRVGQPMFLVKPDFEPLNPDVSLKMENVDALHPASAPRL